MTRPVDLLALVALFVVAVACDGRMSDDPPDVFEPVQEPPVISWEHRPHPGPRASRSGCRGTRVSPREDPADALAAAGSGGTVCLLRGVHRVSATLRPRTGQRLIGAPGAVLTGAAVLPEWRLLPSGIHAAPAEVSDARPAGGNFPDLKDASVRDTNVVFLDGEPLQPARSLSELEPGLFFHDRDQKTVYLSDDPTDRLVEIVDVQVLIRSSADNVRIKGLVIEKAGRYAIDGRRAQGWRVVRNEVRFVHQVGVCTGDHSVVRANLIHHNGQAGLCGSGHSIRVLRNEIAHNNRLGFRRANGDCWDAGGGKWVHTQELLVRGNYVHDNNCHGLWTDIDSVDSRYEENFLRGNDGAGIFDEIGYGALVTRNVLVGNTGPAIAVASSRHVRVIQNSVVSEGGGIVGVQQDREPGPLGPYLLEDVVVRDNITVVRDGITGAIGPPGGDAGRIAFRGNTYFVTDPGGLFWTWWGRNLTARGWVSEGHDTEGRFRVIERRP